MPLTVQLHTLPTVVGSHNSLHTRLNCGGVTRPLDGQQLLLGRTVVAAINAAIRAAVANEMLGRGENVVAVEKCGRTESSLQSLHHPSRIDANDVRPPRVSLVGSTPAAVMDYRDRRRKCPVYPRRRNLLCRSL